MKSETEMKRGRERERKNGKNENTRGTRGNMFFIWAGFDNPYLWRRWKEKVKG